MAVLIRLIHQPDLEPMLIICLMQDAQLEERLCELCGSQSLPKDLRQPDLLIRSGGEKRLSNFMLWDMAYSELHFCDVAWPSFSESNFVEALLDYSRRKRSFGLRLRR